MEAATVHPMRLALGGLFAMLMAFCVRLVQTDLAGGQRTWARFGFSPPSLVIARPEALDGAAWHVADLEDRIAFIQADTQTLRQALRQMRVSGGIVPAFASANPVSADDVRPASGIEPKPAPIAAVSDPGRVSADLYAPAADLPRARSLFYGAQLGIFSSRRQALETWQMVDNAPQLLGHSPRFVNADDGGVRLIVGPLPGVEAEAVCEGVRSEAPDCTVAPYVPAGQ